MAPGPFRLPLNSARDAGRLWYQDFSSWRLRGIAFAIGIVVFASAVVAQWFAVAAGWSAFWLMVASDGMAAIVAGLFALKLMRYTRQRRRTTLQRLKMIAEMNHHIRNSLEIIALSAHAAQDRQAMDTILAAAERIQWTLREILPEADTGEEREMARQK
jgi:signal transduction histidine kinase